MKQILLFTMIILGLCSYVQSQVVYTLPSGYQTVKGSNDKEYRIDADFDSDGISDLAVLCSRGNDLENIVVVYLSTKYFVNKLYYQFLWEASWVDFKYENNVLIIDSAFGNGRFSKVLKFKYYSKHNNMRLIGYEEYSSGNYAGEGGYSKTVNLLTNQYEVSGVWKKTNFDLITLSNVNKYFEYLEALGDNMK